jgi:hypothetical protein
MESEPGSSFLIEHDLFRKPVSTFRDHALALPALIPREPNPLLARCRGGGGKDQYVMAFVASMLAYLGTLAGIVLALLISLSALLATPPD